MRPIEFLLRSLCIMLVVIDHLGLSLVETIVRNDICTQQRFVLRRLPSSDDRRHCCPSSTQDQYDKTPMTPTAEQTAILARAPNGIIKVAAGAGCDKTSTLVEYGRHWPARGLYLAFNRSIADEAGRKFPATIQTRTAHSFAYRALNIGKRSSPIASYRFEHLQPYREFVKPVAGMTYGQVRAAILRTRDSFMTDAGSKLRADHCSPADIGQRTAVGQMVRQIAARMLKIDRHQLPIGVTRGMLL
jgi:hypothetical protein